MILRIILLLLTTCTYAYAQQEVIYSDNGEYGNYFTDNVYGDPGNGDPAFDIDFNNLSSTASTTPAKLSNNTNTIDPRRDVEVTFTALTIGRNGFFIYVNNVLRADVGLHVGIRDFRVILSRNVFNQGRNRIRIWRYYPSSWGLTNIQAKFNPVIPLVVDQPDSSLYGYRQSPARYTGLRVSFNLSSPIDSDYVFYAKGWDMDVANETQLFLNKQSIGYLSTTPSNDYGLTDRFLLNKEMLVEGLNLIEFQQRTPGSNWSGIEDEKWAVKDLLIEGANPNLSPILPLLLSKR